MLAPDQRESLYALDARELVRLISTAEVSAREVMASFLERIDAINPEINAICTLLPPEQALAMAEEADRQRQQGKPLGALHGLPIACKDLAQTRGMRTTMGSLVFKDNIPTLDSLFVERLRQAGALIIGKTNTPEFGAGSNTFNAVFGATRNPYDQRKTAGGSSGGAAAALAARMLPIADGSDMGGSLRNPAAFCNVAGFRPSMGRVPSYPANMAWQSRMGVEGPMARNVDDLALLLSVMAGPDPRDPRSIVEPASGFSSLPEAGFNGTRIAWSPDLGMLDVEQQVKDVCAAALPAFTQLGCQVDTAHPDMHNAMEVFRVLRANHYAAGCGPLLAQHRDVMKKTLTDNIEIGLALTAEQIMKADEQRTALYHRVVSFFQHYDFLVLPSTQVVAFDHEQEWVKAIEGRAMSDYLEWMSICCMITVCDLPALSIPCGFTADGLPLGLQIVGKPWADKQVLQLGRAFESLKPWYLQAPDL